MSKFNSLQEMADTISSHLFTQGHPAMGSGFGCAYRGESGRSCAVGCLIDDEKYSPRMENMCASDVLYGYPGVVVVEGVDTDRLSIILDKFQSVHDANNWGSADTLRNALASVYDEYGLSTTTLSSLNFSKDR